MARRHAFTKLAASSWWLQRALGGFLTPKIKYMANTDVVDAYMSELGVCGSPTIPKYPQTQGGLTL